MKIIIIFLIFISNGLHLRQSVNLFQIVKETIHKNLHIPRRKIKENSNLLSDLGIDDVKLMDLKMSL